MQEIDMNGKTMMERIWDSNLWSIDKSIFYSYIKNNNNKKLKTFPRLSTLYVNFSDLKIFSVQRCSLFI